MNPKKPSFFFASQPQALITGFGGFTGGYLAEELTAAGYQVFGTVYGKEPSGKNTFSVNLCSRQETQHFVGKINPQVVVHLAAVSFVAHDDVEEIYRVNLVGTRNLLEALAGLKKPPESILIASSANVYGNTAVETIDERVLPAPANDYAVSKLAMEYMARLWMDRLPITIIRPFNYTGVGQSLNFVLPKIVDHFVRNKKEIELGNIDVYRDFLDVRTVVDAYGRLIMQAPAGGVFNVCSGRAVCLEDVLGLMETIAGCRIRVNKNPLFVRENEIKRLQGNPEKLINTIGPLKAFSLEETLRWMYTGKPVG